MAGELGKAVILLARDQDLSARPVIATVYECSGPEGRILTDKPCADGAKVSQVREPNRMNGEPPIAAEPAKPTSSVNLTVTIPPISSCKDIYEGIALYRKRLKDPQYTRAMKD